MVGAWPVRQPQPVRFSDHRDARPAELLGEEVLEPDAEHQRDAQERRQGREQQAALDLRQHRRRQAGVTPELHQAQLLPQPQGAQLRPDAVLLQAGRERIRNHFHPSFSPQENDPALRFIL